MMSYTLTTICDDQPHFEGYVVISYFWRVICNDQLFGGISACLPVLEKYIRWWAMFCGLYVEISDFLRDMYHDQSLFEGYVWCSATFIIRLTTVSSTYVLPVRKIYDLVTLQNEMPHWKSVSGNSLLEVSFRGVSFMKLHVHNRSERYLWRHFGGTVSCDRSYFISEDDCLIVRATTENKLMSLPTNRMNGKTYV